MANAVARESLRSFTRASFDLAQHVTLRVVFDLHLMDARVKRVVRPTAIPVELLRDEPTDPEPMRAASSILET
eukprot:3599179-Alexandrium_andersonii.AAC.1